MDLLRRHPALACLLLGAVAACGFAPLELWWLTLACFAVWMWLVHDASTIRQALWRGWVFGVGHFTINDNWFQHAFDFQDKMPPVLGYAAPIALALYLAVYPAMAAGLAWRFRRSRVDAGFVLAFGAAWIASEYLRAVLFTGYAWDPIGVIWVPVQPVAMLAAWIGTYSLSGLTVALAGALLLLPRRRAPIALALAALAVLLVAQGLSYRQFATPPAPARGTPWAQIVQPNVSQDQRGETDWPPMIARLSSLTGAPGDAPRLVLWPEGVVRPFLDDGYPDYAYIDQPSPYLVRRRLARLLGPRDILLAGTTPLRFDRNDNIVGASNSVQAIDSRAQIIARYDKAHLVPYGEYLPMPWLLRPIGLARLVPGDFDFDAGPGPRSLTIPGFGAIGIQVCYEIIFSGEVTDPARRPRMIFNPSNDAWFGKWGTPQFLAQARMRAIEEALPVVRSTPTGISALIAADGRVIATVPHEQAGAIAAPIPEALPPTLFSTIGNWAAAAVAALLIAGAVALRMRRR